MHEFVSLLNNLVCMFFPAVRFQPLYSDDKDDEDDDDPINVDS